MRENAVPEGRIGRVKHRLQTGVKCRLLVKLLQTSADKYIDRIKGPYSGAGPLCYLKKQTLNNLVRTIYMQSDCTDLSFQCYIHVQHRDI